MRSVGNLGVSAQHEGRDHYHDDHERDTEHDRKPVGIAVLRRRGGRGLEQASHEDDCTLEGFQIEDYRLKIFKI